jgi:hypothetical protein
MRMRVKFLLPILYFSIFVLLGFQALSPTSNAFTLTATVDIKPETLNVNMNGRWITAFIELPEDFNVSNIEPSTILLENMFKAEWTNIECGVLMVKFDASSLTDYLWIRLYHMGANRTQIALLITGELKDGTPFVGSDVITVMNPANKS